MSPDFTLLHPGLRDLMMRRESIKLSVVRCILPLASILLLVLMTLQLQRAISNLRLSMPEQDGLNHAVATGDVDMEHKDRPWPA